MKQYRFKGGVSCAVDAETVAEELERIERVAGEASPARVVEESRPHDALLHPCFEWDNELAAEKWRTEQARNLVKAVEYREVSDGGDATPWVRCFVSVSQPGQSGSAVSKRMYVATANAMRNEEMRDEVLRRALNELLDWQERYKHLRQFAKVFEVIDDIDAIAVMESR